jgi:hypothetical protein
MKRLLRDGWEIFAACVVALVSAAVCSIFNCEED